jgi:DNA-binding IclR family transcriptional regulator
MPPRVQSSFREPTDMGFWAKSVRIFKYLCDHGTQSVRRVARKTGFSKSSVHRLTQAMQRRDHHPESWLWETAEGRQWLTRLVIATLYTFGLKRGVGLDTISEFFVRLHLATSDLRHVESVGGGAAQGPGSACPLLGQ